MFFTLYLFGWSCIYILAFRSRKNVEENLVCDTLIQCENKDLWKAVDVVFGRQNEDENYEGAPEQILVHKSKCWSSSLCFETVRRQTIFTPVNCLYFHALDSMVRESRDMYYYSKNVLAQNTWK
jgi:hypothetical protein